MRENEQMISKTATEVLTEVGIRHAGGRVTRSAKHGRAKVAKHHARRAKKVLKEAGIHQVHAHDE